MSSARRFAEISSTQAPTGAQVRLRCAVVLGGSIAGLMAARVLSDHAEHVVIIERDDLETLDVSDERMAADPVGAVGPRPGVPQGSQVHALLPAGQFQLERWFPGFVTAALATGAVSPPPDSGRFYLDGRLRADPPTEPAMQGLISSRPFLEALIRNRVLARTNVRAVHGRGEGLTIKNGMVTGVRWIPAESTDIVEEAADFVVDSTGRSSHLGDWIGRYGYPAPPMQRMHIKLNYATAVYQRPPAPRVWSTISVDTPGPARTARIGGFTPIEGERWTMLVSGYAGDRPTSDPADYRRRCEQDFPPEFGEVASTAERTGEVITYHQADSRRRDFDRLGRFPARLVAAGDAVASFNPVYGQGMTSAMLHASCLSRYLHSDRDLDQAATAYFADVRVVVDAAWRVSTLPDLALPHVDGPYPRGYRTTQWFGALFFQATTKDPIVNRQLGRVTAMLAHPSSLTRPALLLRALAARTHQ